MCFSAEASFSAAALLTVVGGLCIKKSSSKSDLLLSAIPFLFAIQQFSEGIIWLHSLEYLSSSIWPSLAQFIFLVIAFAVWPIWIPFSLLASETIPWKKFIMLIMLLLGVIDSYINLHESRLPEMTHSIMEHSIRYAINIPLIGKVTYAAIILIPCFISSLRYMKLFGLLIALGWLVADYMYFHNFTSVWCFFAAWVSFLVYLAIRSRQNVMHARD